MGPGERFGHLTTMALSHIDPTKGRIWICQCDCGGTIDCSTSKLNATRKRGYAPGCYQCLRARVLLRQQRRRAWTAASLRRLWESTGTLYSDVFDDMETAMIREASGLSDAPLPVREYAVQADAADDDGAPNEQLVSKDRAMGLEEIGKEPRRAKS